MSTNFASISISLDGFVAGPRQTLENPLGEGGERLHEWAFQTAAWKRMHGEQGGATGPDSDALEEIVNRPGAVVMGRKMFGGGDGPWDEGWKGWWGDEPPYHSSVFVLTHHPREPLEMLGGTTFNFVTDGIESALAQAVAAAGSRDVIVAGGASAIRQALAAGLLGELVLHVVPIMLGSGERLLEDVGDPTLIPVEAISSTAVTHLRYRVEH